MLSFLHKLPRKKLQIIDNCDKTKELKNLDHNHTYRNIANKKAVPIIGDSILNGINIHGWLSEYFKVIVKNHPGATTENIGNHLKPEI